MTVKSFRDAHGALDPDDIQTMTDVVQAVKMCSALLNEWRDYGCFRSFEVGPYEAFRAAVEQADKLTDALPPTLGTCENDDESPDQIEEGDEIGLAYNDHEDKLQAGVGEVVEIEGEGLQTVLRVKILLALGEFQKDSLCWAGWDPENEHWVPAKERADITGEDE